MKKKILFINPNWEQEPLLKHLKNSGHTIYGIVEKNNKKSKNIDYIFYSNLRDLAKMLEFAKRILPDAVVSDQCDISMFAQAYIAENLKLPGPTIENAQISSNKLLQREKCLKLGIKIPKFTYGHSIKELIKNTHKFKYPLVIKPIDNRGSFGVYKLKNQKELCKQFYHSIALSESRTVIVEEFIEGLHLTVDGYVFKNTGNKSLACASKKLLNNTKQVSMEIMYPADISLKLKKKLLKLNEKINNKLGYIFGFTHSEYMMNRNGEFFLIETANRGGGCLTSEVILPYHSNFDVLSQLEADILGFKKKIKLSLKENPVILKFFEISRGKIKKITGDEILKKDRNILSYRLNFKENDIIEEISNDGNRHGFVIIKGDYEKLSKYSDHMINQIKINYF